MTADVYLGGKRLRLKPEQKKGEGGEAEFYDIGSGLGLKLFKQPDHPDFMTNPDLRRAVQKRLDEHQRKLRAFPTGLPSNVITPQELAQDSGQRILGFTLKYLENTEGLLSYTKKTFRSGIPNNTMRDILLNLHATVAGVHPANVVIGDFNDLNVLVNGTSVYLIDADSAQFGGFLCKVFTARFVDPLLCDKTKPSLDLIKPHTPESDWFAFAVMVFQCFTYASPFGGVYQPKKKDGITHDARPLHGISVFHADVMYPKPAVPYGVLPDELLHEFQLMFEKNKRGTFPVDLLERMRWTTCTNCHANHARPTCPNCATAAPAAVKQTIEIRGTVTATHLFRTTGVILNAAYQNGQLQWLYHEQDAYRREDQQTVLNGPLDPRMRYRIHGAKTLFGKDDRVVTLSPTGSPEQQRVDITDMRPVFDVNGTNMHWTENGALFRDGPFGPERVGDVLSGLTHIWTGPSSGFGFYRASQITVAFVFNTTARGINDTVKLPQIRGKLIDAACVFTKDRCWFFTTTQEGPDMRNRCSIVAKDGTVVASHDAISDDGSWLSQIRGGAAAGNFLLMPTDNGVVRVEPDNGKITVTRTFPDTEPFVDANTRLFIGSDGLYAVGHNEIIKLVIS